MFFEKIYFRHVLCYHVVLRKSCESVLNAIVRYIMILKYSSQARNQFIDQRRKADILRLSSANLREA